jgi:putative FmdB family regulatory protein
MPIYEYKCNNCGVFEVTQRITEPSLTECPTCNSADLHRLISHTSFVLKGSGWYATDYAKSGSAKSDASDSSASAAGGSSSGESNSSNANGSSSGSSGDSSTKPGDSAPKPSSDKSSTAKPAE